MNYAGRYHDAVLANIHANDVDQAAEAVCKTPYGPDHNMAMLINAASWSGEVRSCHSFLIMLKVIIARLARLAVS